MTKTFVERVREFNCMKDNITINIVNLWNVHIKDSGIKHDLWFEHLRAGQPHGWSNGDISTYGYDDHAININSVTYYVHNSVDSDTECVTVPFEAFDDFDTFKNRMIEEQNMLLKKIADSKEEKRKNDPQRYRLYEELKAEFEG